jgi:hypothetical protein
LTRFLSARRSDDLCPGQITLSTPRIDFGSVFLRFPTTVSVLLVNPTNLPARYEMVPQDEASQIIAVYRADKPKGVVPARAEQVQSPSRDRKRERELMKCQVVSITIEAGSVGAIALPAFFNIIGADYPALQLELVRPRCHLFLVANISVCFVSLFMSSERALCVTGVMAGG